jgi:hypothetical protein
MALFIAKTPKYRANENIPSEIRGRYADLRPSSAENQAISRLGVVLQNRAAELKKERDAAVVGDLYNTWRESEREVLAQIGSKTGKDAVNLGADYDTFFDKSSGKATEEAENGTQQAAVTEMMNSRRNQSLDSVARYESAEGKRYKNEQQVGVINNKTQDAREAGFDEEKFENARIEAYDYIVKANPGMSEEALGDKLRETESQIVFANMQSRIATDPALALNAVSKDASDIESWKDVLGKQYQTLKNNA